MIKSLKKLNKRTSQPKARENKSEIATITPKAIVKALYPYDAQGDDELSFRQKDFLYIVDNSDPEWYVACNPLSNTSGLVPVSYFEVIQRPDSIPSVSLAAAMTKGIESPQNSRPASSSAGTLAEPTPKNRKSLALYGFVLYDFVAERNDELEAKRGESIIIIAQSNAEWFVAKPIGRLGGPGLIPVSYVQLREVGTDKPFENFEEAIQMAGIPQVEEWKRRAAEYKASSIPLGRFEDPQPPVLDSQASSVSGIPVGPSMPSSPTGLYVKNARVDRFAINGGRYWYLVNVEMSNGKFRNLCRYYQDFYDFQIKLLEEFPEEAGRTGKPRSLPFMPGPLTLVNHSISSQRRANLDEYVRKLVCMPQHISRSSLITQLFAVRPGDIEGDEPTSQTPIPPEDDGNSNNQHEKIDISGNLQQPQYTYQQQQSSSITREAPAPLQIPTHIGPPPTLATPTSTTPSSSSADHVKVKVFHDGELIAIRVPTTLSFTDLYNRIGARLSLDQPQLYLNNDFTGHVIDNDSAFRKAIVNGKIVLYAK